MVKTNGKGYLLVYILSFSCFPFPFLKAKCWQLAAEIKALPRVGKVQMERAALSYVCNTANASKGFQLLI